MYASHFSIENIPFGIAISAAHPEPSVVTRLGDTIIFLDELGKAKLLSGVSDEVLSTLNEPNLNKLAALSKAHLRALRTSIQAAIRTLKSLPSTATVPISEATLHLPVSVGDFTDFSCSRDHNLNASEVVFQKRELPPGFEYFPGGYTARASSIVVSGTPITRPKGQFRDVDGSIIYGPTRRMDYELEVACIIGKPNPLGQSISVANADEHIFGLVLLNDWSARDIQAVEMTPLGPLNGKSFGTSISPWVITLEALAPFKAASPVRNPDILASPYLQDPTGDSSFSIKLSATLQASNAAAPSTICTTDLSTLYWTFRDLVAHQTSNGCNLNTGDVLATGTVSGVTAESHGCLMELAPAGGVELKTADGKVEKKMWLADGDTVSITAVAGPGVGFGECVGRVVPAN